MTEKHDEFDGWLSVGAWEVNNVLHNDRQAYTRILDTITAYRWRSGLKRQVKLCIKREALRLREEIPEFNPDLRCVGWNELVSFWLMKHEEVRGGAVG